MSTLKLFDVHTHVQFAAFEKDADLVIKRALDAGVWMINVGTQKDTSAKAVEFANKYKEGVYASVGLHPIHAETSHHDPQEFGLFSNSQEFENKEAEGEEEFNYDYYKKLAKDPRVVAIGECGLDYYRATSDKKQETRERQKSAFLLQIELAKDIKKPLMIHCRSAFLDLIDIFVACRMSHVANPGIVHFFSGTKEDARKLLDMGFSFSFGGVITFARDYDEVIKYIPLEKIVLETDAPYVAPVPYRGKRNEPLYIIETVNKLTEIKNVSLEKMAGKTTENAKRIFNIS